jgi:hypothetical protein
MYRVWLGRVSLFDALRDGKVTITGRPSLVRSFSRWFQLSPIAYASAGLAAAR